MGFSILTFDQTRKYCQSFHESTATLKLGKAVLIENSLNFNTNTLEIPHSYSSSCELSSLLKHVFQFFVSEELLIKTASKETPGGDDITAGWGEHWNCTTTLATSLYTVRFLCCSWCEPFFKGPIQYTGQQRQKNSFLTSFLYTALPVLGGESVPQRMLHISCNTKSSLCLEFTHYGGFISHL